MWEATTEPSTRSASRWNTNLNLLQGGEEDHHSIHSAEQLSHSLECLMTKPNDERSTKPEMPKTVFVSFGLWASLVIRASSFVILNGSR